MVLSSGWLVTLLGRQSLPPLLPAIIDDLAISPPQAGFALTLMWLLYSLHLFPGGRLSDRLSRKTVLVAGLGVMISGFGLLVTVVNYPIFLFSVALIGTGAGLYFIATRALLSDLFVERRGQAFGVQSAAGALGSTSAAGLAIAALALATWQVAFLPIIVLLSVGLILIHLWNREQYVLGWISFDVLDTGSRLFANPKMRWVFVAYVFYAFSMQAIGGFLPTFLQVDKGFSPTLASLGFALLYVVGIFSGPVAGNLGDRFAHTYVAVGVLLLGVFGLGSMLVMSTVPTVLVGILLFSTGVRSFPPVMQAYLMSVFPDDSMGGDFGALKSVYTGLGSLGPVYVGLIAEITSYTVAFSGFMAFLFVSSGIVLRISRASS